MVHDDKYETSNCSKISFEPFEKFILQIVREICRFVPKLLVRMVQKFGKQVQKLKKMTKKQFFFVPFSERFEISHEILRTCARKCMETDGGRGEGGD